MKQTHSGVLKVVTVAIGFAFAISAQAQMKVYQNGHIGIGSVQAPAGSHTSSNGNLSGNIEIVTASVDTAATVSILGKGMDWSEGKIAFGGRGDVWIGESTAYMGMVSGTKLTLQGKGGLSVRCGNKLLLSYSPDIYSLNASSPVLDCEAPIQAPQYLTTSDARLKNNISSLEEVGELVEGLTPVSYTYKDSEGEESGEGRMKNRSANTSGDHKIYGFLAQEVREVLPDLVYEDQEGMLSIDYQGFIPVLVDAVKGLRSECVALRETIAEQQAKIERLENGGRDLKQTPGNDSATLSQNRPNPFRIETEIRCHLPEDVANAFIYIYDLYGNQKQRIQLSERGDVTVTVSTNSLNPGLYIYSLIADGVEVDSKRMILTD